MPRIPYPDLDTDDAVRAAASAAGAARGGTLINLYRMLLHAPPLASAWLGLGTHLRYGGALDDRTRELVVCLVARRTASEYEWHHHAPLARAAGVTDEQLAAVGRWQDESTLFGHADIDVLDYAEAVLAARVDDERVARARSHLGDPGLVELTALVAYYLGASRFLDALGVEAEGSST